MMKEAIDDFVSENYNRVIKPKLNRRDDYGKVVSNPKTITREVKDRYFKMYNGNLKIGK